MTYNFIEEYDIIVIGAGHAGVEASLAGSRMGCKVLLATINIEMLAFLPCNPSIGGSAKGIVVREVMPSVERWPRILTSPTFK